MCGIIGSTLPNECPPEVFGRMIDMMQRRGPDGRGEWRGDEVVLGHRRLSVLDPTDRGAQPMSSPDDELHITYNGEFYNHREKRIELEVREWASNCDTETLLALYEKHGPEFIRGVNGMFALAIYDEKRGMIYVYRDRLGIKPLYYYNDGRRFVFASSLRAIASHPQISKRVDQQALRDYMIFGYVPSPQSILEGIRKLEPGWYLEYNVRSKDLRPVQWWKASDFTAPDIRPPRDWRHRLEEKADELEELLFDSVKLRTLSDVPLGCFLSGGIDSSAVAWALANAGSGQAKTFNIGFEQAIYDESYYAERVARHLGTQHTWRTFTGTECRNIIPQVAEACDEPFADASLLPTLILSEMTRQHVTVSLSGDGGDELFLGYDRYQWTEKVYKRLRLVPPFMRKQLAESVAGIPSYKMQMIARGLSYDRNSQIYPYVFAGWNQFFANELFREEKKFADNPIHSLRKEIPKSPLIKTAAYTDLRHYLPDDILTKIDRASMHYSLEARVPLLDYRIVEFAMGLPQWMNYGVDGQKQLLKLVLHRHVPEQLFRRPKSGFAVPLKHWFRGPLRPLLKEMLSRPELARHNLFSKTAVRRLYQRHQSGRYNFERQLWALLVFQLWHHSMFDH